MARAKENLIRPFIDFFPLLTYHVSNVFSLSCELKFGGLNIAKSSGSWLDNGTLGPINEFHYFGIYNSKTCLLQANSKSKAFTCNDQAVKKGWPISFDSLQEGTVGSRVGRWRFWFIRATTFLYLHLSWGTVRTKHISIDSSNSRHRWRSGGH